MELSMAVSIMKPSPLF